jgi:hypothetical protein
VQEWAEKEGQVGALDQDVAARLAAERSRLPRLANRTVTSPRATWAMKTARHRGMKKAIVALARRLAVVMHRIWVDGTEFRWTWEVAAA